MTNSKRTNQVKNNKQKALTTKKNNASQTTARQWQLLAELEQKRWRGTTELQTSLKQAGFEVSLRTIQRDLNALKANFPIESSGSSPQGWRWSSSAPMKSMPQMSLSQAVVFALAEQNLTPLLPKSLLNEITPWFRLARTQLGANKKTGAWLNNIRMIPATQPLIGARIDGKIQDVIYEALLSRRKINASYQKRTQAQDGSPKSKRYILNPIALIQRGVVMYLIATRADDDSQSIRMFAMHRFKSARLQLSPSVVPENFDLDNYIASGAFGFNHPKLGDTPIDVVLTFSKTAGASLLESQLSNNQTTKIDEDAQTITVYATVTPTAQLVWWLRGFGKSLLSIKPSSLADAVND